MKKITELLSNTTNLSNKYKDPENSSEIIQKIFECKDLKSVLTTINDTYPTWIVATLKEYSKDYPHLTKNWYTICKSTNTNPAFIIIVDYNHSDDDHKLLTIFSELLTRFGICVRRRNEYIPCSNCSRAIPSEEIWKEFKKRSIRVPIIWSKKCVNCS